jgi:hypothetical protein
VEADNVYISSFNYDPYLVVFDRITKVQKASYRTSGSKIASISSSSDYVFITTAMHPLVEIRSKVNGNVVGWLAGNTMTNY